MAPALVATIVAMLPNFLLAALIVQIRDDTGLTVTGLGVVIGIFFAMAALVSPAAGRASERLGWARGLRVATLMSAAALGMVGWFASGVPVIAVAFAIAGIASSLVQTASNLAVARCVVPQRHGWIFGVKHACVPAAMFLAGLAVPTLAFTIGWAWAFRIAAIAALVTVAAIPGGEGPSTLSPRPSDVDRSNGRPSTPTYLLIILALAVGFGIGAADPLGSFFVAFSVSIGVEEQIAGLLLAAGGICGILARLIAGRAIDRVSQADLVVIAVMMSIGALGVVILNLGGPAGLILGGLLAFTFGWGWSGLFTFAVVRDNPDAPAAAWGIPQTGKFLGAALGPMIFGIVAEQASFRAAYWLSTAALLLGAALMVYVRNRRAVTPSALPGLGP